jgi:ribosome maturation factor RimP
MGEQEDLTKDMAALLSKLGIDLLEFTVSRRHNAVQVKAVVHGSSGTGIDECSRSHRLIAARLEEAHGIVEPYIEVSSPGIDRQFRSPREYAIFAGKRIRILREGETEWQRGRLLGIEGDLVSFEDGTGRLAIPLAEISKARLDSTSEGE